MVNSDEPNTAHEPDRWYDVTLGTSFRNTYTHSSPKLCTLRYEFKPASIDKSQPGSLHKRKYNRVTVEYHNNQHGKPKVTFEGVAEDYKENDAVLFFDGENFRLERLHLAVKRLRHVRLPGESASTTAAAIATSVVPEIETHSLLVGKGENLHSLNKGVAQQIPLQVEHGIGDSQTVKFKDEKSVKHPLVSPSISTTSLEPQNYESAVNVDIINDDDNGSVDDKEGKASEMVSRPHLDIDINLPHQADMDDETADVDISDEEADQGPNAAEALRAQVNAEGRAEQTSSSSISSNSDSSESEDGSGSGSTSSSSSESESSDGVSITSV